MMCFTSTMVVLLTFHLMVYGKSALDEACSDRFCPIGTFCDLHEVDCKDRPCKPLTVCLPDAVNGCSGHPKCPPGQVCVEHRTSCISRSCKREARCAVEGTCDAFECLPSEKCVSNPSPHCVKIINN